MKLGVIGAGAWGTAFAIHLAKQGHQVLLWVYEQELYDILQNTRENTFYLPSFNLPDLISFTQNLEDLFSFSDDIVVATPSFALRKTLNKVSLLLSNKRLLLLTKGFEENTLLRMSEVVREVTGKKDSIAVLSGPSFAREVAQGVFTSVVVSSDAAKIAKYFQSLTHNQNFRV
jgi:glycerol-3-phosphate dehydrogenase (NAD(P)+)